MSIKSIRFVNFKALQNYQVSFQGMNLLVGPNNSGKSTVLSAFRVLEYALKVANSKSASMVTTANGHRVYGHRISETLIPISLENIHTDYADEDTRIDFRHTNGNTLTLYFPSDGGCILYWEVEGKPFSTPSAFMRAFPLNIQVVPVLGPLEQEEHIVTDETVRRASGTSRASRHFRNYWSKNPEGFDKFKLLIEKTWPGMSVSLPNFNIGEQRLVMFCSENRINRELYWAGFGFQIWCQLLTHIARAEKADLIVIDEPEVYLHPDVQRQLLWILRDINSDVVLATHSTEIIGEAEPSEILIIDKTKNSSKRLKDVEGVQNALEIMGSIQNITLAHLARSKKMIFVEGLDDYRIIRRFAKRLGYVALASGADITPFESGGFTSKDKVKHLALGFRDTLKADIKVSAIYDRDFWCDEELNNISDQLNSCLAFAHIHSRKEIENYLLHPPALSLAIDRIIAERNRSEEKKVVRTESIEEILEKITADMKYEIQGQYTSKYTEFYKSKGTGKDSSTLNTEALKIFDKKWSDIKTRVEICHGKNTLSLLRGYIQDSYGITLTETRIIDAITADEVPVDMVNLINKLEHFRTH